MTSRGRDGRQRRQPRPGDRVRRPALRPGLRDLRARRAPRSARSRRASGYGATVTEGGASLTGGGRAADGASGRQGLGVLSPVRRPGRDRRAGHARARAARRHRRPGAGDRAARRRRAGGRAGDRDQVDAAGGPDRRRPGRGVRARTRGRPRRSVRSRRWPTGSPSSRRARSPVRSIEQWLDEIVTVDEESIADAMVLLMERAKLYVEGAGAVGVAALLAGHVAPAREPARRAPCSPAATSTSAWCPASSAATRTRPAGGSRCSPRSTIDRAAWRSCSTAFAGAGANLIEVEHVREMLDLHVRETGVHATFEVRSPQHAEAGGRGRPGAPATTICRRVDVTVLPTGR